MDWKRLAEEVIRRRTHLGYPTRKEFAEATGFKPKTLGDLETLKRTNFSQVTLAQLEKALDWPEGRVAEILRSRLSPFARTDDSAPDTFDTDRLDALPPLMVADPSWLSTPEGIARHIHHDDLPLVALLYRAGLTEADLFRLILKVRARREQQNAALLQEVAAAIRELGGWAPEQPYPPTWLVALDGLDEANEAAQKSVEGREKSN